MAADITTEWDIEGILTPQESVEAMLRVIPTKTIEQSGTFWTWEGNVSPAPPSLCFLLLRPSAQTERHTLGQASR